MAASSTFSLLSRRTFTTGTIICSVFAGKSVRELLRQPEANMLMSIDNTGQVFRDCTFALVSGGDLSEYLTEKATLRFMDVHKAVSGRQACVDDLTALLTEQFDARQDLTDAVAGESTAAVEMVFSGVHVGDFRGIAPTGRNVSVTYALHFSFERSLISELRLYGLVSGLMDQISDTSTPGPHFQMA